jgi:glycosyltransferase involved in cell wall biosynthesis
LTQNKKFQPNLVEKDQCDVEPSVIIGIPAYNEENSIAKVILQAQKHSKEVVVCDDGSSDMTSTIAKKLGADVISHQKNSGYGSAIWSLICRAKELNADILITLDGDGQHFPDDVDRMIRVLIEKKVDLVVGSRFQGLTNNQSIPFFRSIGNKIFSKVTNKIFYGHENLTDVLSGFKGYNKNALNKFDLKLLPRSTNVNIEIMRQSRLNNLSIAEVPISVKYKGLSKTHKRHPLKLGWQIFDTIFMNIIGAQPLLSLFLPGILMSIAGLFLSFSALTTYFETRTFPIGWALFGTSLLVLGLILSCSGMMLYVIRKYVGEK